MSLNNAKNVNVSFLHIQQGSEESERFAFYGMFWGWFESPKARWKVLQWTCASGEKWIWIRSFKRGTKYSFCLRGCKNIRGQSWRLKKKTCQVSRTPVMADSNLAELIFFRPPTLTSHIFIASWYTIVYSTSFERSDWYLLEQKAQWHGF